MKSWSIYYADREFAREHGDPCLGVVRARTSDEAIAKANVDPAINSKRLPMAALWPVPISESVSDFLKSDDWAVAEFVNGKQVSTSSSPERG